jgi:hypothetical protein
MESKSALKFLLINILQQKRQVTNITLANFASLRLCGKKNSALLIFFISLSTLAISQQKKIASIEIPNVESAYVDRPGDLYILLKDNTLKKFDTLGVLVHEQVLDAPTTFDPRDGSRLFIYSQRAQRFAFFSPETKQAFPVEQQYAIDPVLACASGDNHVWILDRSDWSLKRINPSQSKVIAEALIDQKQFAKTPEFTFIREYQNFLFMIDKNSGIIIFNSLGKQIKKLSASKVDYLNFLGEELYYKVNDKLLFYDLFDSSTREVPIDPTSKFTLLTDVRKYVVYQNRIEIFKNE